MFAERVDFEGDLLAIGAGDLLSLKVDGHSGIRAV